MRGLVSRRIGAIDDELKGDTCLPFFRESLNHATDHPEMAGRWTEVDPGRA